MPKSIIVAIALIMFALMIGLVAYTLVQDQSLKLALIVVAAFDMLAATYLVAKAFRQK